MTPEPQLILWEGQGERLWAGVRPEGPVLVLEQPCAVRDGALFRERLRLFRGVLHPGFVRVLGGGWGDHAGQVCLLLEEVPGLPVSGLPGSWRSEGVLQVLAQLSHTVAAIHQMGLSLGGLSPSRVLLSRRHRLTARILGFSVRGGASEDLRGLSAVARELAQDQPLHPELDAALSALDEGTLEAAELSALCQRMLEAQPSQAPSARPAPMPTDAPTATPAAL